MSEDTAEGPLLDKTGGQRRHVSTEGKEAASVSELHKACSRNGNGGCKGPQVGTAPGTGSRTGRWTVNEGTVAGEEVPGSQADGVECQHDWISCWGPSGTCLNKLSGIELPPGQKYFI